MANTDDIDSSSPYPEQIQRPHHGVAPRRTLAVRLGLKIGRDTNAQQVQPIREAAELAQLASALNQAESTTTMLLTANISELISPAVALQIGDAAKEANELVSKLCADTDNFDFDLARQLINLEATRLAWEQASCIVSQPDQAVETQANQLMHSNPSLDSIDGPVSVSDSQIEHIELEPSELEHTDFDRDLLILEMERFRTAHNDQFQVAMIESQLSNLVNELSAAAREYEAVQLANYEQTAAAMERERAITLATLARLTNEANSTFSNYAAELRVCELLRMEVETLVEVDVQIQNAAINLAQRDTEARFEEAVADIRNKAIELAHARQEEMVMLDRVQMEIERQAQLTEITKYQQTEARRATVSAMLLRAQSDRKQTSSFIDSIRARLSNSQIGVYISKLESIERLISLNQVPNSLAAVSNSVGPNQIVEELRKAIAADEDEALRRHALDTNRPTTPETDALTEEIAKAASQILPDNAQRPQSEHEWERTETIEAAFAAFGPWTASQASDDSVDQLAAARNRGQVVDPPPIYPEDVVPNTVRRGISTSQLTFEASTLENGADVTARNQSVPSPTGRNDAQQSITDVESHELPSPKQAVLNSANVKGKPNQFDASSIEAVKLGRATIVDIKGSTSSRQNALVPILMKTITALCTLTCLFGALTSLATAFQVLRRRNAPSAILDQREALIQADDLAGFTHLGLLSLTIVMAALISIWAKLVYMYLSRYQDDPALESSVSLIPIYGWWKVVSDASRITDVSSSPGDPNWRGRPRSLVEFVWVVVLAFTMSLALTNWLSPTTILSGQLNSLNEAFYSRAPWQGVWGAVSVLCGIITITVVQKITDRIVTIQAGSNTLARAKSLVKN